VSSSDFVVGAVARISVAIKDISGAAADPGALRLKVKAPSGTVTTYTYGGGAEIVRDAAGSYRADVPLPTSGAWWWRWESDAPNPGAFEGGLVVLKSKVI